MDVITEYLDKGGWMMYVLLAISIVGTVIFLERFFALYVRQRLAATRFEKMVLAHVEARRYRQALDACNAAGKHPLVPVFRSGILRANRSAREIEKAMEKEMLHALPNLTKRIGFLALLANSATLLGLLGTILGLISAFQSVGAASAAQRQQALADGISTAMYTTFFGIAVAVPVLFMHHFIQRRSENMVMEVEGGATSLLVALTGPVREMHAPGGGSPQQSTPGRRGGSAAA